MIILVTYDLNTPGNDYSTLYRAIMAISSDYIRPLESVWLLNTEQSTSSVYGSLRPKIDASDRLLITRLTKDHMGWLGSDHVDWINSRI